jgi:hypothetical protein
MEKHLFSNSGQNYWRCTVTRQNYLLRIILQGVKSLGKAALTTKIPAWELYSK